MSQDTATVANVDNHPALRTMVKALHVEASFAETDGQSSNAFVMDVMEKILTAGIGENGEVDFDAIFEAQESGMVSGKDFAGNPFLLKGDDIDIRPSAQKNIDAGGFTHYAIMKVSSLMTGEEVTLNCGGKTFMATLYALRSGGYFTKEKGCPEDGRGFVLVDVPSDAGAYLKLKPFKRPEPARAKSGK